MFHEVKNRYIYCENNGVMKCYNTFIIIKWTILVKKLIDENENWITTFVLKFCVMKCNSFSAEASV